MVTVNPPDTDPCCSYWKLINFQIYDNRDEDLEGFSEHMRKYLKKLETQLASKIDSRVNHQVSKAIVINNEKTNRTIRSANMDLANEITKSINVNNDKIINILRDVASRKPAVDVNKCISDSIKKNKLNNFSVTVNELEEDESEPEDDLLMDEDRVSLKSATVSNGRPSI